MLVERAVLCLSFVDFTSKQFVELLLRLVFVALRDLRLHAHLSLGHGRQRRDELSHQQVRFSSMLDFPHSDVVNTLLSTNRCLFLEAFEHSDGFGSVVAVEATDWLAAGSRRHADELVEGHHLSVAIFLLDSLQIFDYTSIVGFGKV